MNKLQSERIGRIEKLKNILREIKRKKKEIIPEDFILEVMKIFRVGRQSAMEYIKQAQFELKRR